MLATVIWFQGAEKKQEKTFDVPAHVNPYPLYPVLQAQVNDPFVLVHVALLSQLWVARVHSLFSEKIVNKWWTISKQILIKRHKIGKQIVNKLWQLHNFGLGYTVWSPLLMNIWHSPMHLP